MAEDRDANRAYSEVKDCNDLDEFWECISPIGEFFKTPYNQSKVIYRGQSNSGWELVPNVYRQSVLKKYKQKRLWDVHADYPDQISFEHALLKEFADYCDARGLLIPYDTPDLRRELQLSNLYEKYTASTETWPPDHMIPLMALAQHHGIPTRLLDWSNNAYIASYFAAVSVLSEINSSNLDERLAVFGLDLLGIRQLYDNKERINDRILHVRAPGAVTENLSAQEGSFILVPNYGVKREPFRPNISLESRIIEDKSSNAATLKVLKKVTLPQRHAAKLLERCSKFGISAASLFPGYDGAAKAVFEERLVSGILREKFFETE